MNNEWFFGRTRNDRRVSNTPRYRSIERRVSRLPDGRMIMPEEVIYDEIIDPQTRSTILIETRYEQLFICELCGVSMPPQDVVRLPSGKIVCPTEFIVCYFCLTYIEPPQRAVFYPPLPEKGLPYHPDCARRVQKAARRADKRRDLLERDRRNKGIALQAAKAALRHLRENNDNNRGGGRR